VNRARLLLAGLRGVVALGLLIDAYVHLKLAGDYDVVRAAVSEGDLFRVEAIVSVALAALVLLSGRRFWLVLAVAVTASAVGALLANTYLHIGAIGPLPDMYEPTWFGEKRFALAAESIALAAAAMGLLLNAGPMRRRNARRAHTTTRTRAA
jgi:hypothetical protein